MPSVPGWPFSSAPPAVRPIPGNLAWDFGAIPPPQEDVQYGEFQEEAIQNPLTEDVVELVPFDRAVFSLPVMAPRDGYAAAFGSYLWAPLTVVQVEYECRYFNTTRRV